MASPDDRDVDDEYRAGFVALIGRPNVGKSTLLNRLVGQKISIVTPKPQTTRHRILGIHSLPQGQMVFIDTPGMHHGQRRAINQYMNRVAAAALQDADLVVWLVEACQWREDDERVLTRLQSLTNPVGLVVNKVDEVHPKERLLPYLSELAARHPFAFVVPVSATKGSNLAALEQEILRHLPLNTPIFPEDQVTDRSERFLAAELIREQLMLHLQQELPYALTVEIERFSREEEGRLVIDAVIWVEKPGQKAIVIGEGGQALKRIGTSARLSLNAVFEERVHLNLWVKIKENWSDKLGALHTLGYD